MIPVVLYESEQPLDPVRQRAIESQKEPERARESQRGPERAREIRRGPEKAREREREPARASKSPSTGVIGPNGPKPAFLRFWGSL